MTQASPLRGPGALGLRFAPVRDYAGRLTALLRLTRSATGEQPSGILAGMPLPDR